VKFVQVEPVTVSGGARTLRQTGHFQVSTVVRQVTERLHLWAFAFDLARPDVAPPLVTVHYVIIIQPFCLS